MVRRAAASKLGDFAKVQEEDFLKNDVVQMFEELAKDEQVCHIFRTVLVQFYFEDSVRLLSVEAGIVIVGLLREDAAKLAHVKPIIKDLVQDKSWRVRYMAAVKIVEVTYQLYNQFIFRFNKHSATKFRLKKSLAGIPVY